MHLRLRITHQGSAGEPDVERVLSTGVYCLGRSPDSDLCLDDPERVISGRHALIEVREAGVWVTDISRNGTYLNRSTEPLTPHQPIALQTGDRLAIGPYELLVSIARADLGPAVEESLPALVDSAPSADILDLLGGAAPTGAGLQGAGLESGGRGAPLLDDPFGDAVSLDSKLASAPPSPERQGPYHPTPVEHVHFPAPRLQGQRDFASTPEPDRASPEAAFVPDNYDLLSDAWMKPEAEGREEGSARATPTWPTPAPLGSPRSSTAAEDLASSAPSSQASRTPGSAPPPPASAPLSQGTPSPPVAASAPLALSEPQGGDPFQAFMEGIGAAGRFTVEHPDELMREAGALLKGMVRGLMLTMMARAQFKNELRLGATTIRPAENNPFKFLVDPDDLLERLLFRPGRGFLRGEEAVREAFDDLGAHEMAMTAGLQAALRALLGRFEPGELERRLTARSRLDQILPMARKSRYWDLFTEAYAEVAADAAEDFMQLFGESFARAYLDQVERLAQSRAQTSDPERSATRGR